MNWCRKNGIEPVAAERRSLQWWRRRFKTAAAAMVFAVLLPVAGEARIYACFSCEKCYDIGAENAGAALLACQTVAQVNGMAHYGVAWVIASQEGVPCAQLALVPDAGVASYGDGAGHATFRLGPARQVFCIDGALPQELVIVAAPSSSLAKVTGLRKGKAGK